MLPSTAFIPNAIRICLLSFRYDAAREQREALSPAPIRLLCYIFKPVAPSDEYAQRLKDREARVAHFHRLHIRAGNLRLIVFSVFVVFAYLTFISRSIAPWWLLLPLAAFIGLAASHEKILRQKTFSQRAVDFYRAGLARLADEWPGKGQSGEAFSDPHHVYSADLDLFGRASLFELLSTARTRMGQQTLASWLLNPAPLSDVLARQQAVAELRDRLSLREDLAVLGEDAGIGVRPKALLSWAESPNRLEFRWLAPCTRLASLAAVVTALIWGIWDLMIPFGIVIGIEALIARRFHSQIDQVLHGTEHAFEDLALLSAILARLEQESFQCPLLRTIAEHLTSHHIAGSLAITRLRKLVDLSMSRDNLFLRVLDVPLMYSLQVALAVESWRSHHATAVRPWLQSLGEIEALLSLASYGYEHPSDPFPEFTSGAALLEATALGHPLIPTSRSVTNNLVISESTRALLVSGSNMSGKSTLLRATGLNVVLAMAGAPVRAQRMRLSPLQVGASIRINDSLEEGSSRFYSEITRLRQILDLAGHQPPLLFLLDELLQGTNSHDRRIGAEGILRALISRGAIGIVSTHDLAITEIVADRQLRNLHFEDELADGRIRFDYKLRDGVVTKSNGLALMRSIGLEV